MFRRLLSTFPKYTTYSSQYLKRSLKNKTYGFKREIVPSDFEYDKSKKKTKK